MTPARDIMILKRRFRSLKKRERFLKSIQRKRHRRVRRLRLHQRLQLDLNNWKTQRKQKRAARRKRSSAKRETAKLNRTLKRRRRR